ncbi:DNA -binding domain-containing protein [Bradyrhizobium sp. PMVTL-01]|uniref:DNA -binding domain-containing protein n=1 Tax=Bradyrhizobium sp. PMVTL-01 TaxID=3434999 RepID=UPI003F6F3285
MRRPVDGWHALLRIAAVDHRVWCKETPVLGGSYAAELPFHGDIEVRAYAARRLWRSMDARQVLPFINYRNDRLRAAIRALEAHGAGASYRVIPEVLSGKNRVPDRA